MLSVSPRTLDLLHSWLLCTFSIFAWKGKLYVFTFCNSCTSDKFSSCMVAEDDVVKSCDNVINPSGRKK